ncbi:MULTISPECIES: stage III sporulation protein AF [Clostridia]|uniref:Stage III sporulation protein AF n=2 Tax=Clostridia TaxID=186801 RepID=A0A8I0DLH5_9CLOT|nr:MULTISPECIES: stage III sporulation protein AF [Clostridia]MBC5640178.1 stage III sporulation protein AF [Clostridium lentum]MBC5654396.1 stage III sporulation protein AF [Blautia lenta]MEE0567590.1 stage III sporulation protein AF [Clostridium sp.]OKZ85052.1 MAG: stage III sporulation protein AF [Clostridium sp. 29_15]CDB75564.1 sporulation stage III [Clostridium sp. CAG:265]
MEYIKSFIETLVTIIILFSAIELISPNNSMKKYIKFVLGLILIVVMLNPIIDFFTEGEDKIVSTIKEYEGILSTDTETSSDVAASNEVEDVFIENLNKNSATELAEKFPDYKFVCDIDCNIDLNNFSYDISHAKISISTNKIQEVEKIEKVEISNDNKTNSQAYSDDEQKILSYVSNMLGISEDKIEIYTVS